LCLSLLDSPLERRMVTEVAVYERRLEPSWDVAHGCLEDQQWRSQRTVAVDATPGERVHELDRRPSAHHLREVRRHVRPHDGVLHLRPRALALKEGLL